MNRVVAAKQLNDELCRKMGGQDCAGSAVGVQFRACQAVKLK